MKISKIEYGKTTGAGTAPAQRILPKERPRTKTERANVEKTQLTPLEQGILTAEEALKGIPDVREEVVAELKAKIEKGEYKISGEEIADMMIRRLQADKIR